VSTLTWEGDIEGPFETIQEGKPSQMYREGGGREGGGGSLVMTHRGSSLWSWVTAGERRRWNSTETQISGDEYLRASWHNPLARVLTM